MEPIHTHSNSYSVKSRGVTLVELMVVLAIIITLTGVVFTSQSSFNKTLELANTAYDVALTLRSAETYGIGSRVTTGGTTNAGYGLHFVSGASTFTLFADTNSPSAGCHGLPPSGSYTAPDAQYGNCVYEFGVDPVQQTYTLGNGVTVFALSADGAPTASLDIVFARPNPDAFIRAYGAPSTPINTACIKLASPQGSFSFVKVTSSGLVAVNNQSCP